MKAKRIPHHGTKSLTDPGARRRLLRTLGIGTSVALAVAVAFLISLRPKKLTDADRTAMRDYEQLRVALAHDDLGAAKNSATAMLRSDGAKGLFHDSAVVITRADSLAEARSAFARLSEHAQQLVKGNAGFFIVGCAMDRCPVKCAPCRMSDYADWVQVDENVENPFMGKSSPHCGVIKVSY